MNKHVVDNSVDTAICNIIDEVGWKVFPDELGFFRVHQDDLCPIVDWWIRQKDKQTLRK